MSNGTTQLDIDADTQEAEFILNEFRRLDPNTTRFYWCSGCNREISGIRRTFACPYCHTFLWASHQYRRVVLKLFGRAGDLWMYEFLGCPDKYWYSDDGSR